MSALLFLFEVTLDLPDLSRKLVPAPRPRNLPDVLTVEEMLSVEEVARLLETVPGIKHRVALVSRMAAVSEVAHLRADDIDSKRTLIRIEEGNAHNTRFPSLTSEVSPSASHQSPVPLAS